MLGILGGGQLARLLILAAHRIGIEAQSLVVTPEDPAAKAGPYQLRHRPKTIPLSFLKKSTVLTFESEWLSAEEASRIRRSRVQTFPAVPILQRLSDRAHQKAILDDHAIPTAHWLAPKSTAQAEAAWQDRARHPHGLVRKVRLGGYDGYGTSVARRTIPKSKAAFTSTPEQLLKDVDASIFESLVPFDRELAITIGRTRHGRLFSFPWVETRQTQSRCLWVKGPVSPSRAMNRLENQLLKLLTSLGYIGVLTAEVFDVRGRLLVNELAPRVHNSCHHSLDSTLLDQFEAHLLCHFSDAKLRPPRRIQPSACFSMVNLLGRSPSRPGQEPGPPERLRFNGRLHWYGKAESRPGRKLGHITNLAPSLPKAIQLGIKDLKAYGWPLKREDEK